MSDDHRPYYITTPIYYVNGRPHLGHGYTTVIADVLARFQRMLRGSGAEVFFLTGTDEHADKVVSTAASRGMTPQEWAGQNAEAFEAFFRDLRISNDDFIRTSQDRHKAKVEAYIRSMLDSGDIYKGDYTGWYDPGQEEYVTETAARENEYKSPVSGEPLEKRTEQNYFFRLSAYQDRLEELIRSEQYLVLPEARRNEVLGRLTQGLRDVPVSRAVGDGASGQEPWGVLMPGDPEHRIYVWIDALFNYLSTVDTDERRHLWPASVHLIAKDILWFHAVIWPAMLMALGRELPRSLYVHAYFMMGERKMSKSLGNFVTPEEIHAYADRYGIDAFRWYLATQGPWGANDADFTYAKFVEVYNADLANGFGNSTSRVSNMVAKYFESCPDPAGQTELEGHDWPKLTGEAVCSAVDASGRLDVASMLKAGLSLVRAVDGYINTTEPFRLAKTIESDPHAGPRLAAILYHCAEALRVASLLLYPAMPDKVAELWRRWRCSPLTDANNADSGFVAPLAELAAWGGAHSLKPGQHIEKGEPLFMRADPAEPEPGVKPAG